MRIESFWSRKSKKKCWKKFLPSDPPHSWDLEKKSKFSKTKIIFFFDLNFDYFYFLLLLVPHEVEKGPINSCSLVSPSVRNALFSALALTIFLIFCMKLGEHMEKSDGARFFEKIIWPPFLGQKGVKNVFFWLLRKNGSTIFVEML